MPSRRAKADQSLRISGGGSRKRGPKDAAFDELIEEVVRFYHRLTALLQELHGEGETSAGQRAVLRELEKLGPRTVPEMAKVRPVSRQYIQRLVDTLHNKGEIERVDNPRHRRSHRLQLTAAGIRRLREMEDREARILQELRLPVSRARLDDTTETLASLRRFVETVQRSHLPGERSDR